MGLNSRLVKNNAVLTEECSMFTVPEVKNLEAENLTFAQFTDSADNLVDYGQIKALWIINPPASGVIFWLRGPGDLSPTANNDKGIEIGAGADVFLAMSEGALNSWGGNIQKNAEEVDPIVFVVYR